MKQYVLQYWVKVTVYPSNETLQTSTNFSEQTKENLWSASFSITSNFCSSLSRVRLASCNCISNRQTVINNQKPYILDTSLETSVSAEPMHPLLKYWKTILEGYFFLEPCIYQQMKCIILALAESSFRRASLWQRHVSALPSSTYSVQHSSTAIHTGNSTTCISP